MSKKDKQSIKKQQMAADRQDFSGDIGDIRDFDDIIALSGNTGKSKSSLKTDFQGSSSLDSSSALKKAMAAFSSYGADDGDSDNYDDDENGFDSILDNEDRKRRRAPDDDDNDEAGNIVEEFSKAKKDYLKSKKDHYTIAPRFGGREEVIEPGRKRAATNEIMANRGLTPHRKKENKNPRVKKRLAFEKAVVARKGQVRDVISGADGAYGGELTGIKSNLSKSRRLAT
jgi:hypothetical protein